MQYRSFPYFLGLLCLFTAGLLMASCTPGGPAYDERETAESTAPPPTDSDESPVSRGAADDAYDSAPAVPDEGNGAYSAAVRIDFARPRAIQSGPHLKDALDRTVYFRSYFPPGEESDEMTALLKSLRIAPGRGATWIPGLREDPARPGFVDPASIDEGMDKFFNWYAKAARDWPGLEHAMAHETAPPWLDGFKNGKFQEEWAYRAQAELIKGWYDRLKAHGGLSLPIWYSLWNEPGYEFSGTELGRYAHILAETLAPDHPEVRVAGPTPAWPQPHRGDWSRWARQEGAFIDAAGDAVYGYDYHLYSRGDWSHDHLDRQANSPSLYESQYEFVGSAWDHGRLEAFLDLVAAYHQARWNEPLKPILISEFGRANIHPRFAPQWENEFKPWLHMITVANLWMRFMDRPEVKMTVPFIVTERPRAMALVNDYGKTRFVDFYAFFRELDGIRVVSKVPDQSVSQSRYLLNQPFLDGDVAYVLLYNRKGFPAGGNARVTIEPDFGLDADGTPVTVLSREIKRMRWEGAVPDPHDQPDPDGLLRIDTEFGSWDGAMPLDLHGEEAVVIRWQLSAEPASVGGVLDRTYYSERTTVPIEAGKELEFIVSIPSADKALVAATLGLGVYQEQGFSHNPAITVNGTPVTDFDLTYSSGITAFHSVEMIPFPPGLLREQNTIVVRFDDGVRPDDLPQVTSLKLVARYAETEKIKRAVDLPPEVQREKELLAAAAVVAERHPATFTEDVNTGEQMLSGIELARDIRVEGERVVPLPDDIVEILTLFAGIVFSTSDGEWEIFLQSGEDRFHLAGWWGGRTGEFARRLPPGLRRFETPAALVLRGTGTVQRIALRHQGRGFSLQFDEEPWGRPGHDQPILDVGVTVDPSIRFAIGGISALNRPSLMRVYNLPNNNPDAVYAARFYAGLGFLPSRDAGINMDRWAQPTEPDLAFQELFNEIFPEPFDQVQCFSSWPERLRHSDPELPDGEGTPGIEHFDAAAELAALVIYNRDRALGRFSGRPYLEVKNEPNMTRNWAFFAAPRRFDGWALLADFHNRVATAVRRKNPDWMVGGPSSSMPWVDRNNFRMGRDLITFMDRTHEHLDFYSLHFYERGHFRLLSEHEHTLSYLFGRLEGVFDLLRTHMHIQDDEKPILVTEYGGGRLPPHDVGYWQNIRSFNAYLMRFMQMPDIVPMSVPFVIPIAFWRRGADTVMADSYQLFMYDEERNMILSPLRYFLELWSEFDGDRIWAGTDTQNVVVNAVRDGQTIYVAINNLTQQRIRVDLNAVLDAAQWVEAEQTRLYVDLGQLHFERNSLESLDAIPLSVDETAIVKLTLNREPEVTGQLDRRIFFADRLLQPTGSETVFDIASPVGDLASATLRIALGREEGFDGDLRVTINDREPIEWCLAHTRGKTGMYFGIAEIPIPAEAIRPLNRIRVHVPDRDGMISSVVLVNDYH